MVNRRRAGQILSAAALACVLFVSCGEGQERDMQTVGEEEESSRQEQETVEQEAEGEES